MIQQPFSYYGGKQRMASKIIPYISRHTVYVEPFCGGATVLFNKRTPIVTNTHHYREVINDTNSMVINFFKVLQDTKKAEDLIYRLGLTLYSQEIHKECINKNKNQLWENDLDKAYCFFINISQSFSKNLDGGFSYSKKGDNLEKKFYKKVNNLESFIDRMRQISIFNEDALSIIDRFDDYQTFFYLDPPYINANQGHYSGYTENDYNQLIEKLKTLKGSFILSCYKTGTEPEKWKEINFDVLTSASNKNKEKKDNSKRTETIFVKDSRGGIDQDYFRKIYKRPGFQKIWPLHDRGVK